jgi:1-acyl-sn-glycerol-3-phosphate acyltransferase
VQGTKKWLGLRMPRPKSAHLIYADRMTGWRKPDGEAQAPIIGSAMFEGFCRLFFACYCPLTVEGQSHLPEGPFLLCSNHSSHSDSAALMTASGRSFRNFALLGASDYFFHSRAVRWAVMPLMNVIPIDRRPRAKSLADSLAACRRFLDQTGGCLIMYPEGTRSPDGEMQAFKPGAGWFASELAVPVVPAYVEGSHRILPKGHFIPRPGSVTVRFGEPLAVQTLRGDAESARERRQSAVEQIARAIHLLRVGDQMQELLAGIQEKVDG